MRVGILGSGLMGGKLGTIVARVGHDVVFSYARSEAKLKRLARDADVTDLVIAHTSSGAEELVFTLPVGQPPTRGKAAPRSRIGSSGSGRKDQMT